LKLASLLVFFVFLKQLQGFDPALLLSEGLGETDGRQAATVLLSKGLLGIGFFLFLLFDEACGEDALLNLPEEPVGDIGCAVIVWGFMNEEFHPGCQEAWAHLY